MSLTQEVAKILAENDGMKSPEDCVAGAKAVLDFLKEYKGDNAIFCPGCGAFQVKEQLQKLYHIVDNDGFDYYITAKSFGEAEQRFKVWEKLHSVSDDEIEEPQMIALAGELIVCLEP